jgi:protein gp37
MLEKSVGKEGGRMNKTKIDWADYTWNPVTGCLHGCSYCYARKIANRFGMPQYDNDCHVYTGKVKSYDDAVHTGLYPWGFAPTFHKYRLDEPQNVKTPQRVFVCSMADLFGDWVPDSWIEQVFSACEKAPQHQYLFLTKNPKRYAELAPKREEPFSDNWWFGTTVTNQSDIDKATVSIMETPCDMKCFLSMEPLLGQIFIKDIAFMNWVIVGEQTNPTIEPKDEWVQSIIDECRVNDVPVFVKEPLYTRFPIQQYPKELIL